MTYAFVSTTKARTAIGTLLAIMVFSGTSVAAVLISAAHALTGHCLGLFDSLLGHALCNDIPVCTAKFITICSANVVPHVGCDVVLKDAIAILVHESACDRLEVCCLQHDEKAKFIALSSQLSYKFIFVFELIFYSKIHFLRIV